MHAYQSNLAGMRVLPNVPQQLLLSIVLGCRSPARMTCSSNHNEKQLSWVKRPFHDLFTINMHANQSTLVNQRALASVAHSSRQGIQSITIDTHGPHDMFALHLIVSKRQVESITINECDKGCHCTLTALHIFCFVDVLHAVVCCM